MGGEGGEGAGEIRGCGRSLRLDSGRQCHRPYHTLLTNLGFDIAFTFDVAAAGPAVVAAVGVVAVVVVVVALVTIIFAAKE